MTRTRRLPLGVDIGSTRIRVACAARDTAGRLSLAAVASRDVPDDAINPQHVAQPELVAAIVEDLAREVDPRERRCVLSLPASVATLRVLRFPKMSSSERRRAARFEAERFAGWDVRTIATVVRVHRADKAEEFHAVGAARADALDARLNCLRRAGLRPIAADHDACAMQRAFPYTDAVLDIGLHQSALHSFGSAGALSFVVPLGGSCITRGIASDLSIDGPMAEKRKRILGTAGAGDASRDAFAGAVAIAVAKARERTPIRRVVLVGNGARLHGLAAAIEASTGAQVEQPVSDVLRDGAYPDDVLRAAAPDWTLAACLATWSART